jgi:hypothetical protein
VARFALIAIVVVVASLGSATAIAGPSRSPGPGLTGKVLHGPTTPVCRANTPCYAPFHGTLVFTPTIAGAGPIVPVKARTTAQGNYAVSLDPTRYRVSTGTRSRFGGVVRPAVVSVPKSGVKRVNFVIDTGIR